jgi:hypothetical protein
LLFIIIVVSYKKSIAFCVVLTLKTNPYRMREAVKRRQNAKRKKIHIGRIITILREAKVPNHQGNGTAGANGWHQLI